MATNAGMKAIAKEEKRLEKERKRQVELANKMLIPVSKKTLETLGLISFDPKGVFRLKDNRWMSVYLVSGDFKALARKSLSFSGRIRIGSGGTRRDQGVRRENDFRRAAYS